MRLRQTPSPLKMARAAQMALPSYVCDSPVCRWLVFVLTSIDEGNIFEATPEDRRQIGVVSASFLIFNRVIGTGIFATPSTILSLSGSVGLSLFMWVAGTLIAVAGTAVYLEWGTAIPKYVCSIQCSKSGFVLTRLGTEVRRTISNTSTRNPSSWPRPCLLPTPSYSDGPPVTASSSASISSTPPRWKSTDGTSEVLALPVSLLRS